MRLKLYSSVEYGAKELAEETQLYPSLFAQCRRTEVGIERLTPYVKCREFLTDSQYWWDHPLPTDSNERYGFRKCAAKPDWNLLLVRAGENLDQTLALLHQLEEGAGFKTRTEKVHSWLKGKVILLKMPNEWVSTTALYSYYTYLVRTIMGSGATTLSELDKNHYTARWCKEILTLGGHKELLRKLLVAAQKVPGRWTYNKSSCSRSRHSHAGFKAALQAAYNWTIYKDLKWETL